MKSPTAFPRHVRRLLLDAFDRWRCQPGSMSAIMGDPMPVFVEAYAAGFLDGELEALGLERIPEPPLRCPPLNVGDPIPNDVRVVHKGVTYRKKRPS